MAEPASYVARTNAARYGFQIEGTSIRINGALVSVFGCRADVINGGDTRRTTLTRVAIGTAIAPGIGTLVGALARKGTSQVFIVVSTPKGQEAVSSAISAKDEAKARQWAAAFNNWSAMS